MIAAFASMPVFNACAPISETTASICARHQIWTEREDLSDTDRFWAVIAVIADVP